MKALLTAWLFLAALQVMASPEDMYRIYDKDGKNRAVHEKADQLYQRLEAEEEERNDKKTLILGVSLIIGLIPVGVIGTQALRRRSWEENPRGTASALAIAIAGGVFLFAFNYGFFYLKALHYGMFKYVFSLAVVIAMIIGGFVLLRKKKNDE